jgi:WD40 repeat protein
MVRAVAFAPRGRLLVSGGSGRQVQFWPLAALTGDVRSEVCGYIGSGLSETEWKEFAGNYYYANPC